MSEFTIDRSDLPKPWASPLVFVATDGEVVVTVEVEQSAAIEYQSAWCAGGIALALAAQRTEYFVQSVESAISRLYPNPAPDGRILLSWDDLNP